MSIPVTLYQNKSDRHHVTKDIAMVSEYDMVLKHPTNITNPTFTLSEDITIFATANYLYIPQFRRYYYIDRVTSKANGLVEIECSVDVLMSFAEEIRAQSAIIERQSTNYNLYLNDPEFMTESRVRIQTKVFPNQFSRTPKFILTVAGGEPVEEQEETNEQT